MCRSTDYHHHPYQPQRNRLKINSIHLRFSITNPRKPLPPSLTLHYLPRINGTPLQINDSKIPSNNAAFITLYRVRSAETRKREAVFASREQVRVGEGVRFEVYAEEEKVLKGIFRKDEDDEWKLECKCVLENELVMEVKEVEVKVVGDGHVAIDERVEMVRRRRSSSKCRGFQGLEEIPEEREDYDEEEQLHGCDCDCCGGDDDREETDGEDCEGDEMEMEMEGVRWAVDVGIWVVSFGVGYLVSKASSK